MSDSGKLPVGDADDIRDFYRGVVGWTSTDVDMGGYADYCMSQPGNGTAPAGVCSAPSTKTGTEARAQQDR